MGDRVADEKKGIYHLYMSQDRGIVHSIEFQRSDNKYASVARMRQEERTMGQLVKKYNAVVTLAGNTLFIPGQLVFIQPNVMGIGSSKNATSLARKLGLGGYYVVTYVNLILNRDEYTTELTCTYMSPGGFDSAAIARCRKGGG